MYETEEDFVWGQRVKIGFIFACLLFFTIKGLPANNEPWCVAEDRGPVVPTHEVSKLFLIVHWTKETEDEHGYSECEIQEERDIALCDIYVPRPERVWGDPKMDTLGHEVLHGLLGDFHDD